MTSVKRMDSANTTPATAHAAASGDQDGPVIPGIPGQRKPSALGPRPSDRSDADRAAFAAASYVRPHPAAAFGTAA